MPSHIRCCRSASNWSRLHLLACIAPQGGANQAYSTRNNTDIGNIEHHRPAPGEEMWLEEIRNAAKPQPINGIAKGATKDQTNANGPGQR